MKARHFFEAWIYSVEGVKGGHPRGSYPPAILRMVDEHGPAIGIEAMRYYERLYNDYYEPSRKGPPANT